MISFCFDFYNFYSVFSKMISFALLSPGVEHVDLSQSEQSGLFVRLQDFSDFNQKMNLRFTKNSIILKECLELLIIAGKFWF